jgi:hypothetical protein
VGLSGHFGIDNTRALVEGNTFGLVLLKREEMD